MRSIQSGLLTLLAAGLVSTTGYGIGGTHVDGNNDKVGDKANMQTKRDLSRKMRQVKGKVVQVKDVKLRDNNKMNKVVLLKTDKNNDRLVVDLGNTEKMKQVKKGDEIAVKGNLVNLSNQKVLVASHVKMQDKTFETERKDQLTTAESKGYQNDSPIYYGVYYVPETTLAYVEKNKAKGVDKVVNENAEINENIGNYLGKKVLVRGEVDEVNEGSKQLMTVDYDGWLGLSEVVVLSPKPMPNVKNDMEVAVTGTVERFDPATIKQKYNVDLGAEFDGLDYKGDAVIIADAIY